MTIPFIVALVLASVVWFIFQILRIFLTARRKTRDFFGQFSSGQPTDAYRRKSGWSKPTEAKAKKIDRSTGEYVEFEEIESTVETTTKTNANGSTKTEQRIESQITDVEWEDL